MTIEELERRVARLEADNLSFMSALDEACKTLITNNMVRVMLSSEVRTKIEAYLTSRGVQYGPQAETK